MKNSHLLNRKKELQPVTFEPDGLIREKIIEKYMRFLKVINHSMYQYLSAKKSFVSEVARHHNSKVMKTI